GPGDTVGIFGLGGVGHMALQFALLTGADVVAVGRSADHLRVARELGATRGGNSAAEQLPGDTLNAAITFPPSGAVTEQALSALAWGGTLVSGVPLSVSGFPFNKAQTIKASILGNRAQQNEVLRLAADGKVRTVVDRFPMREGASVLGMLAEGK